MNNITLSLDHATAGAVKSAIVNELKRFLDLQRRTNLPEIAEAIENRLQVLKKLNDELRAKLRK